MTREEKSAVIQSLQGELSAHNVIYLTDISGLNAAQTEKLRRACFNAQVKLSVVKNTLFQKAIEGSGEKNLADFVPTLKGNTALMLTNGAGNLPARLISEARKSSERPLLKAAYIDEMIFVGDEQLKQLAALKSKNELIGEVIGLLQSPLRNILSALLNKAEKSGDKPAEKAPEAQTEAVTEAAEDAAPEVPTPETEQAPDAQAAE